MSPITQHKSPFPVRCSDGIEDYWFYDLARDPSTIVATPSPPGEDYFFVDDLLQIRTGNHLIICSEAENEPITFIDEMARLSFLKREMDKYQIGGEIWRRYKSDVDQLGQKIAVNMQANKSRDVKSVRKVVHVDLKLNLIVVSPSFKYGHKPRVLGSCVRILGYTDEFINVQQTEQWKKEAKKQFGANWEDYYNDETYRDNFDGIAGIGS